MKRHDRFRAGLIACAAMIFATIAGTAAADFDNVQTAFSRVTSGSSMGSGCTFRILPDGTAFVVTNEHVTGKRGSRCRLEYWTETGQIYSVAGTVVAAFRRNDVDIAVVAVQPSEFKTARPTAVPLATAWTHNTGDASPVSMGSPGGRWPSMFKSQIRTSTDRQITFFPKPGGGRSGSVLIDANLEQIVGLIAWSSGGDSRDHGGDGRNTSSGFGIAQPVGLIWSFLRNEEIPTAAPIPGMRPIDTATDEATAEEPAQEPTPAFLRKQRSQWGPVRVAIALAIVGAVAAGLFIAYRYLPAILDAARLLPVALIAAGLTAPAIAQESQTVPQGPPTLQQLDEALRAMLAQPVADLPTVSVETALAQSKSGQRPAIVIVTTENCQPCEQMKDHFRRLVAAARLNHYPLAIVDAEDPAAARVRVQDRGFPQVMVYTPPTPEEEESGYTGSYSYGFGTTTENALVEWLSARGIDTTPTPEPDPIPRTPPQDKPDLEMEPGPPK